MGFITALSATGLAAGLVLTGVHVAGASTASAPVTSPATATSASITLPSGGVLEERTTAFCARVPQLLERAGKASTRLSADAGTRGSLAWLKAHQVKAQENHHPRVSKRLDRRIDRRTERLAKLPEVTQKLTAAKTECATLDLPATSVTPVPTDTAS